MKTLHLPLLTAAIGGLAGPVCRAASLEDVRVLAVPNASGMPGEFVEMEVWISEVSGLAGADFAIQYDTGMLDLCDVQKTPVTSEMLLAHDETEPGRLAVSMAQPDGIASEEAASLVTLRFEVLDSAGPGMLLPVTVRTARWYDEGSLRYSLLGDHGVLSVGTTTPLDDPPELRLSSLCAVNRSKIEIVLRVSSRQDVGGIEATIAYPPDQLVFESIAKMQDTSDWSLVSGSDPVLGILSLALTGDEEMTGFGEAFVAELQFSSAFPGTTSVSLSLETSRFGNLEDFDFYHRAEPGRIGFDCEAMALVIR